MASIDALAKQLAAKVYELVQGFEGRENTPEAQAEMVDALAKALPSVPLAPIEVGLADPATRPHDSPSISFKVTIPPWMARKLREDLQADERETSRACSCIREIHGSWTEIGADRISLFGTGNQLSAAKNCERCRGTGVVS